MAASVELVELCRDGANKAVVNLFGERGAAAWHVSRGGG